MKELWQATHRQDKSTRTGSWTELCDLEQPTITIDTLLNMSIYLTEITDHPTKKKTKPPGASCNTCDSLLSDHTFYVDGRMKHVSSWADMCWPCFKMMGAGIGIGYGQVYRTRSPHNKVIITPVTLDDRDQHISTMALEQAKMSR